MGSDKAFLELAGRPLLTRALEVARTVTEQVIIVGDPAKFAAFGTVVTDIYPGHGPLGGIHAALSHSDTELNLMLGVDLPFLDSRLLNYLVLQAEVSRAIVTVPFAAGNYQPLCAVYRKEFAGIAESALLEGRNKIDVLFPQISVRMIDEEELTRAGCSISSFRNLNTPEEWEEAKREFDSRSAQHLS